MGSKLGEASEVLGVDKRDYAGIRKRGTRRRIAIWIVGGLSPVAALVSGFALGLATRPEGESAPSTYPIAAASIPILHTGAFRERTRVALAGTIVLSVLAFGLGFIMASAEPETAPAVMYGVARRVDRK